LPDPDPGHDAPTPTEPVDFKRRRQWMDGRCSVPDRFGLRHQRRRRRHRAGGLPTRVGTIGVECSRPTHADAVSHRPGMAQWNCNRHRSCPAWTFRRKKPGWPSLPW